MQSGKEVMKLIYATSVLAGTIIGVGLFSLPFITLQVGFLTIIAYFLILGGVVILIHLFFGELAIGTPDLKRLPGFAKYHLGKLAEKIAFFSSILGGFGSLLAYLIVGGEFLTNFFSPFFGGSNLFWTLVYFLFGAFLIFKGIKAIGKIEFFSLLGFFLILFIMFFREKNTFSIENLFLREGNNLNLFLPYGPILFSLWGASLIPEVEEMLKEKKHLLSKVITISILIAVFVYLFFIYLILGISGDKTTEFALTGLKNFVKSEIIYLALFFGILTTFTSFIALGLTLKKILWYDLKINKNLAWLITCFLPLLFFLIGFKKFIPLISFIGGVMLGIEGILILLMYRKYILSQKFTSKNLKIKKLAISGLILLLLIGIFYEIYFLK